MARIEYLSALEILDSRGKPTLQATCSLADGALGTASVPSGASTGQAEALELRDGDARRFGGLGCQQAVAHVNTTIHHALGGRTFADQQALDAALLALDGTPNKARLGANAILAVSLAFARANAQAQGIPLYRYFADTFGGSVEALPLPMINLFSGGKHAGQQVAVQDVQIVPLVARNMSEVLAVTFDVFYAGAEIAAQQYGMRLLRADEGGLAPPFTSSRQMLETAVLAIEKAGYQPGTEVALTVDVAASHFFREGVYHLEGQALNGQEMVAYLAGWLGQYPVISIEDGLAEEEWAAWAALRHHIGDQVMVLGDDLLCTNPARIQQAIASQAANALLLKVNQVGTLTEAAEARRLAKSQAWQVVVSARSGETEDNWLADLAVGWSGDFIKVGSITQSERLAKYNRLLAIEQETKLPLKGR